MKTFVQDGTCMDITAAATYTSGQVVALGNILGVATANIASGAAGVICTSGVFAVPKVAGAVIAAGESLTWDVSAAAFDDNLALPASGDITGAASFAFEAAGAGVTTIKVMFTGAPGTKTA